MTSIKAFAASAVATVLAFLASPGGLALTLYFVLNVINALLGRPAPATDLSFRARLDRLVDRLVVICRRGADNRLSLPLFGVSVFSEVKGFFEDERSKEDGERETSVPKPPASQALLILGLSAMLATGEEGCRLRDPDGCQPFATRCSPLGIPQLCSASRYWSQSMADECPAGTVCGLAPVGLQQEGEPLRVAHRCARPSSLYDAGVSDHDAGVSE